MATIGLNLLRLRLKASLSQRELASKINVKQPYLARVESGKTVPKDAMLQKFAKVFKTTIENIKSEGPQRVDAQQLSVVFNQLTSEQQHSVFDIVKQFASLNSSSKK